MIRPPRKEFAEWQIPLNGCRCTVGYSRRYGHTDDVRQSNEKCRQQDVLPHRGRGTALVAVVGFEAVRPNDFDPGLCCLNHLNQLVVSAAADNPLPATAGPFPPLGGHCLLSDCPVSPAPTIPARDPHKFYNLCLFLQNGHIYYIIFTYAPHNSLLSPDILSLFPIQNLLFLTKWEEWQ